MAKKWVVKPRGLLLLLGGLYAWITAVHANPAVLLKAYPAEIIRGRYLLGQRVVHVGERVQVLAIDGARASVATRDGDPLTVYVADLRRVAEPETPVATASPSPAAKLPDSTPTPVPAPTAAPAPVAVVKSKEPGPTDGSRRETPVQCGCLTKKGTPCTRMTRSPNGFCWQHGGD